MTSEAVTDLICGLYCKNITIVNDTFRVVRSDAPSCGITYDHHSDSQRCHLHSQRTFIAQASLMMIAIYNRHLHSSFTIILYNHHLQSSFTIVIYNRHLQSSFTIVIYNCHLQSSFTIVIYNRHLQSSFTIVIYNRHL